MVGINPYLSLPSLISHSTPVLCCHTHALLVCIITKPNPPMCGQRHPKQNLVKMGPSHHYIFILNSSLVIPRRIFCLVFSQEWEAVWTLLIFCPLLFYSYLTHKPLSLPWRWEGHWNQELHPVNVLNFLPQKLYRTPQRSNGTVGCEYIQHTQTKLRNT